MNRIILLLFVGFTFSSCKRELAFLFSEYDDFEVIEPRFDYLTAKAKIKFDHNSQKISASANLRVKKDSVLWISISPVLGIELARIMINQNNIFILDKLNKQYHEYSFEELETTYGIELDYSIAQSVLFGNLLEPYKNQRIEKNDGYYAFTASRDDYFFQNFVGTNTMKLERLSVKDRSTQNAISVTYGNFSVIDSQIFPNHIVVVMDYDTAKPQSRIDVSYNKIVIEKSSLSFPFSVPNKYERK